MNLGELLVKISGPLLFSVAFVLFLAMDSSLNSYLETVKGLLVNNEVYNQSDADPSNELFEFSSDGSYNVSGSYLAGILVSDVTERVVVDGDRSDMYQRLVIDPNYLENVTCYTAYKSALNPTSLEGLDVARSGVWIPGESLDLRSIVDYTSNYVVSVQYDTTGKVNCVTYTKTL